MVQDQRNWKEFRTEPNSFGTRLSRGGVSFSVGRDHRDRDRCDQPPCSMQRPTPLHRRPSFSPVLLFTLVLPLSLQIREKRATTILLPFRRAPLRIAKLFQMLIARLYDSSYEGMRFLRESCAFVHPLYQTTASSFFIRSRLFL